MKESQIVKRTHKLMLENRNFDTAIDATVGNGYDTIFLSKHYKKVIGIDIQSLAIKRTQEKTKDIENISLYLDDFNNINSYGRADLIVFNLGFLPGSNKKIKTQDFTSDKAILKAYSVLDGIMLVACYIQHDGGYEEYIKVLNALNNNSISYEIEDNFEGKEILIIIRK